MTVDAALIAVPPLVLNGPSLGPALLKAYAKEKGYNVKVFNPNIDLFKSLDETDQRTWPFTKFDDNFSNKYEIDEFLNKWIDDILACQPKFIGLSVHTWSSDFFIRAICKILRERVPDMKIALGGAASREVCDYIKDAGLIDYYVVGDGEIAFLNMLEDKWDHPGLNSHKFYPLDLDDFKKLPPPDFSDDDLENYRSLNGQVRMYLTGSRGCVYDCSFCNVPTMMKYRFKEGADFAHEIKKAQREYRPDTIEFGDSLINGSLKQYKALVRELAQLNRKEPDSIPKIVSFYRVRSKTQSPEEDFKFAKRAGFFRFKLGIESGSQLVREHIGKTETNDDIFHTFEMMKKYGINANLLIIVGYPVETEEEFQKTLDFLQELIDRDLDSVVDMAVVNELYISSGTGLAKQIPLLNITDAEGAPMEKMDRPWTRTHDNGEVLDKSVREHRVQIVLQFIEKHFKTRSIMLFTGSEDANKPGDKS